MEKYRPSNGTEGDIFQRQFCERCINDDFMNGGDGCGILARALAFNVDHPDYPEEWVYDADGDPVCAAFKELP